MKRKLTSLLLCGALAASMMAVPAAAESTSDLSGELTLLHYLTEDAKLQALDDLIAGFEAENPNVTVNAEAVSYDNYLDVIKLVFHPATHRISCSAARALIRSS